MRRLFVVIASLMLAAGLIGVASADTLHPTQSEAQSAVDVIQHFVTDHPDATTTSTTVAPTTTTVAPTTTTAPSSACGLTSAAFCETFDSAYSGTKTQTGDLDPTLWGVSRLADINPSGVLDGTTLSSTNPCGTGGDAVPADVRICTPSGGSSQMVESQNDGGAITDLDTYPKQPFDWNGRTGKVVFDVSADSDGSHGSWPEFVITDKPVPGTMECISECDTHEPHAVNEVGFSLAGGDAGPGGETGVDRFYVSNGGTFHSITPTTYNTVTKGSRTSMNHFEVDLSQTRIDVYGTDAGSTTLQHIAGADLTSTNALASTFTKGLVWLNDVHYNARKAIEPCMCGTQYDHFYAWDNLGFDGPKTYRDWGFDVPLAHTSTSANNQHGDAEAENLGYLIGTSRTLSVTGVDKGSATGAQVVFNGYSFGASSISVSVNGHTAVSLAQYDTYHWMSETIPIPTSDVVSGTNTLAFTSDDGSTTVANVSLIMVAAASVP